MVEASTSLDSFAEDIYFEAHEILERDRTLLNKKELVFNLVGPNFKEDENIIRYHIGRENYATAKLIRFSSSSKKSTYSVTFTPLRPMIENFPDDPMPRAEIVKIRASDF